MDSSDVPEGRAATGEPPVPANIEARIAGLHGDLLQLPVGTARTTHIHQPSFRDNEFATPSQAPDDNKPHNPSRAEGSRAIPPVIIVQDAQSVPRRAEDKDYQASGISASDSDASDVAFSNSIQMVDDGGYGAWKPSSSHHPTAADESSSSSASDTEETRDQANRVQSAGASVKEAPSTSHEALRGVGSFVSGTDAHENATSEEVAKRIDVEKFVDVVDGKLRRALEDSAFNNKDFLPLNKLCSILSEPTIRKLLAGAYPGWAEPRITECIGQICGPDIPGTGRRRILAVLVMIEKVEAIDGFIESEVLDIHLPLDLEHKTSKSRRYYMYKKGHPELPNPLPCCHGWQSKHLHAFKQNQAYMLASYLNLPKNDTFYYKLPPEYILPFVSRVHKEDGGYGRVSKVQIHKAHHNFPQTEEFPDAQPYFALKELRSHDPAYFKKEVEVLQRFSGRNKPNPYLIRLLLAFRYGDTHYLLFNWADGNLKQYWASVPEPEITHKQSCLVMQQCLSIAMGLQRIHHVTSNSWPSKKDGTGAGRSGLRESDAQKGKDGKDWGRHGDIKPENILWFRSDDKNRLVISDFGLSRYHSYLSKSRNVYEDLDGFSPTYRPPDVDMRKPITPRYDIWALGCVFLEFLSWYLLGHVLTDKVFTNERIHDDKLMEPAIHEDKFFNVVGENGQRYSVVKPSVTKWIKRLHAHEACPEFVHAFLDLIENHLMVVDSNNRWDCAAVVREVARIRDLCEKSEEYSTKGKPKGAIPSDLASPKDEENEQDQSIDILQFWTGDTFPGNRRRTPSSDRRSQHGEIRGEQSEQLEEVGGESDEDDAKSRQEVEEVTAAWIKSDTSMSPMDREEDSETGGSEGRASMENNDTQRPAEHRAIPSLRAQSTMLTSQGSGEPETRDSVGTTRPTTATSSRERLLALPEASGWEAGSSRGETEAQGRAQRIGGNQPATVSKGIQTDPEPPAQTNVLAPSIVVAGTGTTAHTTHAAIADSRSGVENPAELAPSSHQSTQARGASDLSVAVPSKTSHDDAGAPPAEHSSTVVPAGEAVQPGVGTGSRGGLRKIRGSLEKVWRAITHWCAAESE